MKPHYSRLGRRAIVVSRLASLRGPSGPQSGYAPRPAAARHPYDDPSGPAMTCRFILCLRQASRLRAHRTQPMMLPIARG